MYGDASDEEDEKEDGNDDDDDDDDSAWSESARRSLTIMSGKVFHAPIAALASAAKQVEALNPVVLSDSSSKGSGGAAKGAAPGSGSKKQDSRGSFLITKRPPPGSFHQETAIASYLAA